MNRYDYLCGGARIVARRGEQITHAKLTDEKAHLILHLYRKKQAAVAALNEKYSAKGLAARFGVSVRAIEKLVSRESWGHLKGNPHE